MDQVRNEFFMQEAFIQAKNALKLDEIPVGAVVVLNEEIIGKGFNQSINKSNPTGHAEIIAIQGAGEKIKNYRLADCDLYVTLEPCPMCAAAISNARLRRLYYGAGDPKSGGVAQGARVFAHPQCHHVPEVYDGIAEGEAGALLRQFFATRRKD